MNLTFKQFVSLAKGLKLKDQEKAEFSRALRELMANEPLTKPSAAVRKSLLARHNRWSNQLANYLIFLKKPMPILLILAILLGGGATFAAEKTLPGDALYPVKIVINENVRSWLAFSDQAEAALQAKLAERRLEEAEKLATKSRFDSKVAVDLENNFEEHAGKINDRVAHFAEKDRAQAAEVNADFDAALKAHEKILSAIVDAEDNQGVKADLAELLTKLRAEEKDTIRSEEEQEAAIKLKTGPDVQTAAEAKLRVAENKVAQVASLIDSKKVELGTEAVAQAEARLKLAQDLIAAGKVKLQAKAFGEAFVLFQKAQSIAQEAKLLIEAKMEFEHEENDNKNEGQTETTDTPTPSAKVSPSPAASLRGKAKFESEIENESLHSETRGGIKIDLGL